MQDKAKNVIKLVLSIITAAWSVFTGVLFIIQTWRIFALGAQPFTPENISAKFTEIAIPTFVWLALVLASLVVSLVLPDGKTKPVAFFMSAKSTLNRLQARMPSMENTPTENEKKIISWKVYDCISWCVCAVLGLLCLCVAVAYVVGGFEPIAKQGFFAQHVSAELLLRALPWVFGALGTGVFAVYFHAFTQNKRIALMKTVIAEQIKKGNKVQAQAQKTKESIFPFTKSVWFLPVVRGVVGALAITLIIVGICNGGMTDVFNKAVRICTQCIGLG